MQMIDTKPKDQGVQQPYDPSNDVHEVVPAQQPQQERPKNEVPAIDTDEDTIPF